MSQYDNKSPGQKDKEKLQQPKTLLTDEEMAAGHKAFVELVKARDKMIAEEKKAKGISDVAS